MAPSEHMILPSVKSQRRDSVGVGVGAYSVGSP